MVCVDAVGRSAMENGIPVVVSFACDELVIADDIATSVALE